MPIFNVTTHNILENANVLVLGLGSHGGGASVARYCAQYGAHVTVYDKKTTETLSSSINNLSEHHRRIDFSLGHQDYTRLGTYDIVIKNPAMPRTHPLLNRAPIRLTDIALFLAETTQTTIAVTGTKGKSTTVSAIAHGLQSLRIPHTLVGNIGIAALDTLPSLTPADMIILELSSFQLGDYAYCIQNLRSLIAEYSQTNDNTLSFSVTLTPTQQRVAKYYYEKLLQKNWPDVAVITNIFPDHLDYYPTMEDYITDKMVIFEQQTASQYKFINTHSSQEQYSSRFMTHGNAKSILYDTVIDSAILTNTLHDTTPSLLIDQSTDRAYFTIDNHTHTFNCTTPLNISHVNAQVAIAQSVLKICTKQDNNVSYETWYGVPYRLEIIMRYRGITIINDSAATIPVATLQNISQLPKPIFLICGGSDKGVDLSPFIDIGSIAEEIFLLSGSATDSIVHILQHHNIAFHGPFSSMQEATESAWECMNARRNITPAVSQSPYSDQTHSINQTPTFQKCADAKHSTISKKQYQLLSQQILILSPGCASFGMFRHEFDRGDQFVQCVRQHIPTDN